MRAANLSRARHLLLNMTDPNLFSPLPRTDSPRRRLRRPSFCALSSASMLRPPRSSTKPPHACTTTTPTRIRSTQGRCSSRLTPLRAPPARWPCPSILTTTLSMVVAPALQWRWKPSPLWRRCSPGPSILAISPAEAPSPTLKPFGSQASSHPAKRSPPQTRRTTPIRESLLSSTCPSQPFPPIPPVVSDLTALEDTLSTGEIGTVVVTLGTTAVGSVDSLDRILHLRQKYSFRIHVDAAYGGYFTLVSNLAPKTRRAYDAIPAGRLDRHRSPQARPSALRLRSGSLPRSHRWPLL